MSVNPILAHLIRGDLIENRYRGSYVVVDADDNLIAATGSFRNIIYPRSSLKPIQALAMIESGAADKYGVTDAEIALTCASHSGEIQHVTLVKQWLDRMGLSEADLECGAHAPLDRKSAKALIASGEKPTCFHNTCSGKHAGFLTLALFQGVSLKHYTAFDHPVQTAINDVVAQMTQTDINRAPKGIDGCQLPLIGVELMGLARAMATLVDPKGLSKARQQACNRVVRSMQQHPFFVAGTERFCTDIIEKTNGEVLVKMGADGVFSASVPKRKWGIALKIDDGNLRAAEISLLHLLVRLQIISNTNGFTNYLEFPIHNWNGNIVGKIQSSLSLQ